MATPWPNYYRYQLALSLLQYYVLATLARRPLHAYALAEEVAHVSQGAVVPAQASIKHALERLQYLGFIARQVDHRNLDGRRRGQYVLTATGQRRLQREITNLEQAVRAGQLGLQRRVPATT